MGGSTLALAPACLALAGWVTWLHLRPDVDRPLWPSPLAWLSPADQGDEGRARLSVRSPWLWLTRLTLIGLLLCVPVTYQPWVQLLQDNSPSGTLVLATGPISVNPSWERPLWFISPSQSAQRYRWLDAEGATHSGPIELHASTHELYAPRVRLPELDQAELEALLNSASSVLRARGQPARDAVIARASSPYLLAARLSWRTLDSPLDSSLSLYLEAHIQHPISQGPVTLRLETLQQGSWLPLQSLNPIKSSQQEHGLWEAWLEPSHGEGPLRVCLDHPPLLKECLSLALPPRSIKVARGGWPEGAKLILEALTDVEWVDERDADWVSWVGRAEELSKGLQSLSQVSQAVSRVFIFLEGDERESPVWGEDLTMGTLEQIKRWGPIPSLSVRQLSDLAPWATSSQARSLAFTPHVDGQGLRSLTPVLKELTLESARRALKVVMVGWRPHAQDELTTLSTQLDEWATLHRARVITHTRGLLPLSLTRHEQHQALAELLTVPLARQQTRRVTLGAVTQVERAPVGRPPHLILLWCILTFCALLLGLRRNLLSVTAVVLCVIWALSASPEGSSLRGLGGLWVDTPSAFVTLDERSGFDQAHARAQWRTWRNTLEQRGVSLHGQQRSGGVHLHIGNAPPNTGGRPLWVIPTSTLSAQRSIGALSSAWATDQRSLWVSASLMADLGEPHDDHRYELWLQSASAPLFMGACQGMECAELRVLTPILDPRGALSVALYQATATTSIRAHPDLADMTLVDERAVLAPERPAPPTAWSWGQQSTPWLSAAGYLRRRAGSLRQPPPEDVQLISLHDIPAERISDEEIETLERWVSTGGTLLLSGRSQSFDQGGWLGTRLERLSPFRSRPTSTEQARVLFLIDVSGSVAREAGGPGVSALIEDSLRLATQLSARDEVALITFAGDAELVIPPTPVKDLSAVMATSSASGGSVLKVALDEALRWLGERGPQRWVLLTDGELSGSGLHETLTRVQATRVQRDLSMLVALTSERPLNLEGEQTIHALKQRIEARVTPLSQLTPATFVSWIDRSARRGGGLKPLVNQASTAQPVWGSSWAQARLGERLPPVQGGAGVQLKLGATLLAERQSSEGRHPLLAEWRYGLGRVVALATDEWALSARGWSALLPPSKRVSRGGRRFTWRSASPSLVSSGPTQDRWSTRGVILGPQGEVISGRWRPLLGGGATLLAQDGGPLDERGRPFGSILLRSQTPSGLLRVALSSDQEARALDLTPRRTPDMIHARWLSEREASAPSPALIDELIQVASPPAPLPSVALVILLLVVSGIEARQWRAELSRVARVWVARVGA